MIDHIESVRSGESNDSALRVTTDSDATDIALANISLNSEDYLIYTTNDIAEKLNIVIYDVVQIVKKSNIKGDSKYHRKIKIGKSNYVEKYSEQAFRKIRELLDSDQYIVPEHRRQ
jgi:DNA-directed RNA polymerase subunit H (RpoH/RPB5)